MGMKTLSGKASAGHSPRTSPGVTGAGCIHPFMVCVGDGGGEGEGLKEEEEEERLCRDPKAAPILQARPYLRL